MKPSETETTPPPTYEKPKLDVFPDYVDTTLQQTIVIPGAFFPIFGDDDAQG